MSHTIFALSFSREGFEAIIDLTEIDTAYVLAKMTGETTPQSVGNLLGMLSLRARFNQERDMEVWLIKTSEDITLKDLEDLEKEDPQALANLARQGEAVFSSKRRNTKAVIE